MIRSGSEFDVEVQAWLQRAADAGSTARAAALPTSGSEVDMGRVEVSGNGIRVHAENEGVSGSISGQLVFEHDEEGIRVVLAMEVWGDDDLEMTETLKGLLVKTFQTNSITIRIDGQSITIPPAYRSPLKSFKRLKQLPRLVDVPRRMPDEDLLEIDFGGHDQRVAPRRVECWSTPQGETVCSNCSERFTGARPLALLPPRSCQQCKKQITTPHPGYQQVTPAALEQAMQQITALQHQVLALKHSRDDAFDDVPF